MLKCHHDLPIDPNEASYYFISALYLCLDSISCHFFFFLPQVKCSGIFAERNQCIHSVHYSK